MRRAVMRLEPCAVVYAVRPCGWAAARRERDADGGWDLWHLEALDEAAGVSWTVLS